MCEFSQTGNDRRQESGCVCLCRRGDVEMLLGIDGVGIGGLEDGVGGVC